MTTTTTIDDEHELSVDRPPLLRQSRRRDVFINTVQIQPSPQSGQLSGVERSAMSPYESEDEEKEEENDGDGNEPLQDKREQSVRSRSRSHSRSRSRSMSKSRSRSDPEQDDDETISADTPFES
jgi:hypothetical protein